MRISRVYTNETCNQGCAFCRVRRPLEDPARARRAAVLARIATAAAGGGDLLLTGGEPLMRADLPVLVAHARAAGATRVVLETNASLLTPARATALATAGLDVVRCHLPAWGEALDAITRDPGGFARSLAGLAAAAAAGLTLEAAAPVIAANLTTLARLPEQLSASGLPFAALIVGVPYEAPDPATLAAPLAAAAAIAALEATARALGLPLRMERDAFLPPCQFEHPARVAHLYSLTRGGGGHPDYLQPRGCGACVAADRCPGLPRASLARDPALAPRPLADDRVRRRLSVISSVAEQVQRELAQDDIYQRAGGVLAAARIVRVNFHCNQSCHFCFVSTHLPRAADADVRAAIAGIARQGGVLILSGGEPTLHPDLLDYVRLGRAEGASLIELQTNAITLGREGFAEALVQAGVGQFFISLHGASAAVCEAVTDAPGTWAQTLAGIDRAALTQAGTRLNFVFCQANLHDFPEVVALVAARWPAATLVVSFVASSTDVVPRSTALLPRYTDVMPALARGMARARDLGVTVMGFESMCGLPLCQVPSELAPYFELATPPEGFDQGEFVAVAACQRCSLYGKCFGVRRGYVELYGEAEFSPVAPR